MPKQLLFIVAPFVFIASLVLYNLVFAGNISWLALLFAAVIYYVVVGFFFNVYKKR
ncbi:putative membrane protein SirB2 [Kroppenstedtia sanguinis]